MTDYPAIPSDPRPQLPYRRALEMRDSLPCAYSDCNGVRISGRNRCVDHLTNCAVPGCPNQRITKQSAQYCDVHSDKRERMRNARLGVARKCEYCMKDFHGGWHSQRENHPIFCPSCKQQFDTYAKNWSRHGVPKSLILEWLREPRCYWCNDPISLGWTGNANGPSLDHDHSCCPGKQGCSNCYRGLTHQRCNNVIGQIETSARQLGASRFTFQVYRLLSGNNRDESPPVIEGL